MTFTPCLQVTFTSLDLVLHTEALLSVISFLSVALSYGSSVSPDKEVVMKNEDKMSSSKSSE